MQKRIILTLAAMCAIVLSRPVSAAVSQTPPMGWNSYDCMNSYAADSTVRAVADTMAAKYLKYGWQYLCVDWYWYSAAAGGFHIDSFGRFWPDTLKYPSSANGAGFKPLADYIHSKGLKFGIHLMRGIPRVAVSKNTPIYGTTYTASNAVNKADSCSWSTVMYGLNFTSPSAAAYIKSIFALYSAWGVDFVKVDDMLNSLVSPRTTWKTYIQAYRAAIDSCGREMVFSTSPGATPPGDSVFFETNANQWRMADDLWDNWSNLNNMLTLFTGWYRCAAPGHFPDADMIPIGWLSENGPNGSPRWSSLTRNQQFTMMTMWCIGRSPLIWGGDLRKNRPAEDSLMTNPEVIAVNQRGVNGRPISNSTSTLIWGSDNPDSSNISYLAVINKTNATAYISVNLSPFGLSFCTIRNLWTRTTLAGTYTATFNDTLGAYGAHLFKLTGPQTAVAPPTPGKTLRPVSGHSAMLVSGNRLILPPDYAGAPVKISLFTLTGRRIGSVQSNGRLADLKPLIGNSAEVFIVKVGR